MGETSELMLSGILCSCCGVFISDEDKGYPVKCEDCEKDDE